MRVSCPSCSTTYNIDDKRIPAGGAKLKCAKCQTTFPIKPGQAAADSGAVPLPGSAPAPSAAVPLPGITAQKPEAPPRWDEERTRVQDFTIPGAAMPTSDSNPAVPLPGLGSSRPLPTMPNIPAVAPPPPPSYDDA